MTPSCSSLRMLGIGAAYVCLAAAGHALALPPGFASPLWPAAGLAFGAVMVWGWRCLPGVWLGSFAFNAWVAASAAGNLTLAATCSAAVIGGGSALQALAGALLARRMLVRDESRRRRHWRTILVLFLAGPLVCTISASVGIAALHWSGALPGGGLATQWFSWWVGDSIGVLLAAPVVYYFVLDRAAPSTARLSAVAVPLAVTGSLVFVADLGLDRAGEAALLVPLAGLASVLLISTSVLGAMRRGVVLTGEVQRRASALMASESRSRELLERHQLLLENLAEGVVACGPDGRLVQFNRAAREWHGADPRALPPETWAEHFDLCGPDGVTPLATDEIPLVRAFNGEAVRDVPMSIVRKGQAPRFVIANGTVIRDAAGTRVGAVVAMHDVTERTNAEAELRRAAAAVAAAQAASQAKSRFLAAVSHEIRTPLNGAIGAMEFLSRSGLDAERARLLGTARDSARSLLGLLNDLLDMAKIEAGKIEIVTAPASLEALLAQVVSTHRPAAAEKGIDLEASTAPGVPAWVVGDALRIRQVVMNLVSNAVKFTHRGSIRIELAARPLDDARHEISIRVADTGEGIPPEVLKELFQPFEQGGAERARRSGGAGIGLAICRGLATRMGGRVEIQSLPGAGTTATLALPLEAAHAPAPIEAPAPVALDAARRAFAAAGEARVLVADDHPANRMLLVRQLAELGLPARAVSDGAAALAALRERPYSLLVTDCEMPELDGYGLAEAVRRGEAGRADLTILGCTAHALQEVADRCLGAGMNAVLVKPVELDALARALAGLAGGLDAPVFAEGALGGVDPAFARELIAEFRADHDVALPALRSAVQSGERENCRRLAHRSKGACRMVGADALADAFASFEKASAGSGEALLAALERIEAETRRLNAALA